MATQAIKDLIRRIQTMETTAYNMAHQRPLVLSDSESINRLELPEVREELKALHYAIIDDLNLLGEADE